MANVSIRVDDVVKQRAESICSDLGMSLSTATNLFYKKKKIDKLWWDSF